MTEEAVSLIDLKIADAREDVEKAQAKLDALLATKANQDKIAALSVGDTVTVKYGRADKVRNLSGTVIATAQDEKQGTVIAVQVGEGVDASIIKVLASAVVF